ncbi:MAG: SDR family oxidoreductase [Candidatus Latescibacteria bacterium]|nr:SDR family oxidoreductase [Candidatus Latescibacterota bacterium]
MNGMNLFRLDGKVAALTGGGGVLASAIAAGLGAAGARIAVCDLVLEKAERTAADLRGKGMDARAYAMDVLSKASLEAGCGAICRDFGGVDILVNAAGGNLPEASTNAERSFFDIPLPSLEKVVALNLFGGAILPAQVFGRVMVENVDGGSILNISSMNAIRPLTRIPGYSAAKAAVSNFTQWLAVHVAQTYNPNLRVNAIAPGFFLTDQNRYLLTDPKTGEVTERGKTILAHTPMGRYGEPEDLVGTAVWLASPAARFVTGIVVPVDGGFSAFSGV